MPWWNGWCHGEMVGAMVKWLMPWWNDWCHGEMVGTMVKWLVPWWLKKSQVVAGWQWWMIGNNQAGVKMASWKKVECVLIKQRRLYLYYQSNRLEGRQFNSDNCKLNSDNCKSTNYNCLNSLTMAITMQPVSFGQTWITKSGNCESSQSLLYTMHSVSVCTCFAQTWITKSGNFQSSP